MDKKVRRRVKVCHDFIHVPKTTLLQRYIEQGGTIQEVKEQTFSCYTPIAGHECMSCYPCFRKFAILFSHGAQYDDDTLRTMWKYIETQIIPTTEEGGYQGTYYTDRGEESIWLSKAVDDMKRRFL